MIMSKTIGCLEVFSDGTVKNVYTGNEVGFKTNYGEKKVYIDGKNYSVAVLIYALFKENGKLPSEDNPWHIRFKDGSKSNFSLDNLIKYIPYSKRKKKGRGRPPMTIYVYDKVLDDYFESTLQEISKSLDISISTIVNYLDSGKIYKKRYRFTKDFTTVSWWLWVDPDEE